MVRSIRGKGRKHYGTSSSRQRHDHARYPSSDTAIAELSRELSINPKTVAKWRKRQAAPSPCQKAAFGMSKSRLTHQTMAKGSSILRKRKRDRHSNRQITTAWTDHDPKPLPRLARDGPGATGTGRSCWGVLGGSRHAGWNQGPGHEPTGSGFATETDCNPKSLTDRDVASSALLPFEFLERFIGLGFVIIRHHHGLPV